MKTLWIEDEDALNVGRVIVTKTGTKDCVVCYSCDERADYENRLNADLVAMLTEIQLEIEEIKPLEPTDDEDWQHGCFHGLELMQDKCLKLIQQKINSLKENKDGQE